MGGKGKGKGSAEPSRRKVSTISDWTCRVADHADAGGHCAWSKSLTHLVYDNDGCRALFRWSTETGQWYRQSNRGPKKLTAGAAPGEASELDRQASENAKLRAEATSLPARLGTAQGQPTGDTEHRQPESDFSRGQASWIDASGYGTYGSSIAKHRAGDRKGSAAPDNDGRYGENPKYRREEAVNPDRARRREPAEAAREAPDSTERSRRRLELKPRPRSLSPLPSDGKRRRRAAPSVSPEGISDSRPSQKWSSSSSSFSTLASNFQGALVEREKEDQTCYVPSPEDNTLDEDPLKRFIFWKALKIFKKHLNKDGNVDIDSVPKAVGEILHALQEEDGIELCVVPYRGVSESR